MKLRTSLWALLGCLSCAHARAPQGGASGALATFVDEYFAARYAFAPSEATAIGFHEYDEQLEDRSRARIDARVVELHALARRLAALDRGGLSFDERIDAEALDGHLASSLLDLEEIRGWQNNPMSYAGLPGEACDALMKRDFAPAADRMRAVAARMERVPALFAAARANLQAPPREFTELAIRMSKGSVGFFREAAATWAAGVTGADPAVRARFDHARTAAIAAIEAFLAWLKTDLLPRSTGSYAIGAETFLRKLRYDEGIDWPLDRLLARGEAQREKDLQAFVATARQIDPKRTPAEVMKSLSEQHPAADDLIPSVRRSVEAARAFIVAHDLATIPSQVPVKVEETPPYARTAVFASMDTPGPYETRAHEAFYYVTPVEPDWTAAHKEEHLRAFNDPVVAMINAHEAYPGHYLQFLYAPRFPTKTRRLASCASNAEGWAHYGEQMMVDQGFGDGDPKVRLAQLEEALLRDTRYVVGIKLHTAGWTVAQGAKLFESGFQETENALEEARRGAYDPTYLYYTFGKLEIQTLAAAYRERNHATLKQFHDAFVAQGALPIALVRKLLLRE
jgi:uncharacterized protein (DUF885 family)